MKRLFLLVAVAALALALAGCAAAPDNVTVHITDTGFNPTTVAVKVGGTVNWVNDGKIAHTATSLANFDSQSIYPGENYSHVFDTKGTYEVVCRFHTQERSTVVVK